MHRSLSNLVVRPLPSLPHPPPLELSNLAPTQHPYDLRLQSFLMQTFAPDLNTHPFKQCAIRGVTAYRQAVGSSIVHLFILGDNYSD